MPIYTYRCQCGVAFDEPSSIGARDTPRACPKCGQLAGRDAVASMHPHTDTGYQVEMLSDALGIHPDQIPESKRRFPHHDFAPDGRMRIRSHQEFKRVLKDLGYHDNRGFCG